MTAITDEDREHMSHFPAAKKAKIMEEIMFRPPTQEKYFEGNNDCVKTLLHLRGNGLKLIDLQPQETAFTTIWYGKRRATLLNQMNWEAAAMMVWELNGCERATVRLWRF